MADQGWTGAYLQDSEEYIQARQAAFDVWKPSREYGRWRFRGDDEAAGDVLEKLQDQDRKLQRKCKKTWPGDEVDADLQKSSKVLYVDTTRGGKDVIVVASDSEASDASVVVGGSQPVADEAPKAKAKPGVCRAIKSKRSAASQAAFSVPSSPPPSSALPKSSQDSKKPKSRRKPTPMPPSSDYGDDDDWIRQAGEVAAEVEERHSSKRA